MLCAECRPPQYREGAIFADGDSVLLVKAESIPASAAMQNLSSWRLETGPRDESIQITYSYAIGKSLRRMDGMQVQWALPNSVSIRIPHE